MWGNELLSGALRFSSGCTASVTSALQVEDEKEKAPRYRPADR